MNHLALEELRTLKVRYERLLICTSAEYDLIILDNFVACLTLQEVQFPFGIVRIPNNLLHFCLKDDMLVKFEVSSICI